MSSFRPARHAAMHVATLVAMIVAISSASACRDAAEAHRERASKLDVLADAPTFSLTDQTGTRFGSAELAGHVAIVNFIFTRCPTVCPVFTMKAKRIADRLEGVEPLLLVSISVDPKNDSPEVLAAFAKEHGADAKRWKFLTGDPAAIQRTMEDGLKLALENKGVLADGTPDIVHATHFVLLDAQSRIRGYYDSSEKDRLDDLAADAAALAAVARSK